MGLAGVQQRLMATGGPSGAPSMQWPAGQRPALPPTRVTVLRHCRCLDCRRLDRNEGGCEIPGRNDAPGKWGFCAGYDGPPISRDVLVFRHERQPTRLDEDEADAWQERVAICMVDGGLDEAQAAVVAWRQIEAARDAHVGPRATRDA